MDSPQQPHNAKMNCEPKRSQTQPSAPPRKKDAYARHLSQHSSSKLSSYLEQYAMDVSLERDGQAPSALRLAQLEKLHLAQRKRDHMLSDFSDLSDFSPSYMMGRGDGSSPSFHPLPRGAQPDFDSKPRRGQRRNTATSQDGDIESGEEPGHPRPGEPKDRKSVV